MSIIDLKALPDDPGTVLTSFVPAGSTDVYRRRHQFLSKGIRHIGRNMDRSPFQNSTFHLVFKSYTVSLIVPGRHCVLWDCGVAQFIVQYLHGVD